MKKILSLFLIFAALTTVAQTVNIPISNDIQTKDGKQFYIHTVQRGQTVYSISKAYHVGIKELYYYNPAARNGIQVGQKLWIPTENKETVVNREVKQKSFDFFYHVAAAGETINHVASIYVVPKKYILLANPGLKGPLKEGEYIKIPVEDAYKTLDAMAAEKSAPSSTSNTTRHISTTPKKQEKKISFTPPITSKPVYQRHMQQTPNTNNTSTAAEPDVPFIKNYQHVVIGGETMQSIAKKYDITVAQLKSVNPGLVMIIRGQRLRLPTNAKVPGYHPTKSAVKIEQPPILDQQVKTRKQKQQQPQPQKKVQDTSKGKYIRHTVTRGETLYSISKRYGVNLTTLYRVNKKLTTNLSVGQVILIGTG
jgi:LysM repeat protein